MDKLIEFKYHSDKYVGTNQLVISGKEKDAEKSSADFSHKDLKREKRSKKETVTTALLSKKKRKKLQKIVDQKTKKQKRAELEAELRKFRSEKLSRAAPSPIEIYSKKRQKKRGKKPEMKETTSEEEEDEEEEEEVPKDRASIEEELRALQNTDESKKRTADTTVADPPRKRRRKTKKSKAKFSKKKESSSSSSDEDSCQDAPVETAEETAEEKTASPDLAPAEARPQKRFVLVNRPDEVTKARQALPILSEEFAIMEGLEQHDVIVLTGPTGCGKTTQVPQFLYEAGFAENGMKIGITEPRRVAAISMSKRVAAELCLSSREVSYQIRYEGNAGETTKVKFMTDGVLLQELKTDFYLSTYSAIIIDEAHERSVYTDLLVGILSLVVRSRRLKEKPLKLIIMSATLDAVNFVSNKRLFPTVTPAVVELAGRQHPISVHHLKRTPKDYLLAAYSKVCEIHRGNNNAGGILVFLTGAQEVHTMVKWLRRSFPGPKEKKEKGKEEEEEKGKEEEEKETGWLVPIKMDNFSTIPVDEESDMATSQRPRLARPAAEESESDSDSSGFEDDDDFVEMNGQDIPVYREAAGVHALPLYSLLPSERQNLVFLPAPEGQRLIVVATNVAETSLTIPNVRYVVDCGRVKEKVFDRITGVSTFAISWISKASAKQRAGRAGRTGPGHAHRLYSSQVYEDFVEHSQPEISRRPVEDIVLLLKNFIGRINIAAFPFPTSPGREALDAAEERLMALGALERLGEQGKTAITLQGRYMANLPVAPRFAKILLLAYLQTDRPALPYALLLVCALSVQELWMPRQSVEEDAPETEREKFEKTFLKKGQNLLFGDLTLLLGPVWWVCWQLDKNRMTETRLRETVEGYGLRWKAVMEARKLRRHLTEAVNSVFRDVNLAIDAASEAPPSDSVLLQLRQMLVVAFHGHIARKAVVPPNASVSEKRGLKKAYYTTLVDTPVFVHAESVLYREGHEWLLFLELHESTRTNMRRVMAVSPDWLPVLLPDQVRVTRPLTEPCPKYDRDSDAIVCQAERVEFGPRGWGLPTSVWARLPRDLQSREHVDAGRWFARLFMEGAVVEEMQELAGKWMSTCKPALITQPWGIVRSQVKVLLKAMAAVSSRKELIVKWREDPKFLWNAVSQWLPPSERNADVKWPPIDL